MAPEGRGAVSDAVAAAIERANVGAGPVMAANFTHPAWRMDSARVEATLRDGVFIVPTFADSVRQAPGGGA